VRKARALAERRYPDSSSGRFKLEFMQQLRMEHRILTNRAMDAIGISKSPEHKELKARIYRLVQEAADLQWYAVLDPKTRDNPEYARDRAQKNAEIRYAIWEKFGPAVERRFFEVFEENKHALYDAIGEAARLGLEKTRRAKRQPPV
jgi:hypothetical protein